jgi:carboxyl-terminal processing protease
MKLQGRIVVLLMALSLILGAGVTYVGLGIIGKGQAPISLITERESSGEDGENKEQLEKIESAIELISEQYVEEIDEKQLMEGAIEGMIDTLEDPYSVYMDADTARQFTESLESTFEGIGAEVSMVEGKVTIVAPFKGSPAEDAGLKPNDQILQVDGDSLSG